MLPATNALSKSKECFSFSELPFCVFETFTLRTLDKLSFKELLVAFLLWQEGYTQ